MTRIKILILLLALSVPQIATSYSRIANDQEEWVLNSNIIQGRLPEEVRALLNNVVIQKILLDIAYMPRDKNYLVQELASTGVTLEQFVSSGLVRLEMDRYVINYLLFTKEDMLLMREITNKHAMFLSDAILERSSELDSIMEHYQLEGVDRKAVLFIILACYSLDWDGLVIAANRGYRINNRGNDERTIVWSWEPCDLSKKGFYKGSHNSSFGSVTFTSFGDHHIQPREALPDIIWRIPRNAKDERYSDVLNSGINRLIQTTMISAGEQLGLMMLTLRTGPKGSMELAKSAGVKFETAKTYLEFLMKLGYIEEEEGYFSPRIPVLTKADSNIVEKVLQIGHDELVKYFDNHYEELRNEFSNLTPFRHGIDLADYFYEVWHDIFGAANLILVEEGLFADPYSERYGAKGIIPTVYDSAYYSFF